MMWKVLVSFSFYLQLEICKSFGLRWPCGAQERVKEGEQCHFIKLPCVSCSSRALYRHTLPWEKQFETPLPSFKKLPLNKTINDFPVQTWNKVHGCCWAARVGVACWWVQSEKMLCSQMCLVCPDLDTAALQPGLGAACGPVVGHTPWFWKTQLMNQCRKALLPIRGRWTMQ